MIKNLPWALPQRITFLPIGEIGYYALGRGDAERSECSPFWRVPSLTNVARRVALPQTHGLPQWHPRNADCRGGVFAVFAKIPPPTCPPYARILSDFALPGDDRPHGHIGARGAFVATWRAASPPIIPPLKFPFLRMATALFALKHPLVEQILQSLRSYGCTAIVIKNQ